MTRHTARALAAVLSLGAVAVPALLSPAVAASSQAETKPVRPVDTLVSTLLPDAAMTNLAVSAFEAGMAAEESKDPDTARMFAANPGLREAVANRVRTEMLAVLVTALPELRATLAAEIEKQLTPKEIGEVATFFSAPVGQKLFSTMISSMASAPMADEAQQRDAAVAKVMAELKPEDYPPLMAFGASTAAPKLKGLNPAIRKASEAWGERLVTDHADRFKTAAIEATSAYFADRAKTPTK